jgi:serine/threonine protein kinase
VVFPEDLGLSDLFKDLVRKMLVVDPDKRIGFDDLFNHPWITGKVMVTEPQAGFTKLDATGILKQRWDQSRIIAKKAAVEENK